MKLLTNRQFQGILEKAIKPFKEKVEELSTKINNKEFDYLSDNTNLKNELADVKNKLTNSQRTICELTKAHEIKSVENKSVTQLNIKLAKDNQKLYKKCESYEKKISGLKSQICDLSDKMSQMYTLKELKAEKPKKTQIMGIKNGTRTSRIIKEVVTNGK